MSDEKQQYVLGFMFNRELDRVVLINKTKPDWQAGKLNGVGGKIEAGELPSRAMVREFEEETGMGIAFDDWTQVAVLKNESAVVFVFASALDSVVARVRQTTDEVPVIFPVRVAIHNPRIISNLSWLIPMCINALRVTEWHPLDMPNGLR